jgi:hypothetical protein
MAAIRFDGSGPVARYWLANCEGFAVRGGARGKVEELIRDADPHVTTRFVVRSFPRRRKIVSAGAVEAVVPAKRVVVVSRPHGGPRRRPELAPARRAASRSAQAVAALGPPAWSGAVAGARAVGPPTRSATTATLRHAHPLAAAVGRSFGLLAAEALRSVAMIGPSLRLRRHGLHAAPRVAR